ncbi:MAG: hypothetical protein CAPSK01_000577 [Candidatus Accumulibacter vicinus]|uniref:Uncharacterized protein n=1 Tax=Candidatus Accumulibacter vicinus TaxID=2954382 RepID=A0A084Y4U9_9PROT|nr:MAG: hypothetical protein CAPSK01_000577 [Candidatus Accumulibacter vicinus]
MARLDPAQALHLVGHPQIGPDAEAIVAPGARPGRRKRIGTATLPLGKIKDGTHRDARAGGDPGSCRVSAAAPSLPAPREPSSSDGGRRATATGNSAWSIGSGKSMPGCCHTRRRSSSGQSGSRSSGWRCRARWRCGSLSGRSWRCCSRSRRAARARQHFLPCRQAALFTSAIIGDPGATRQSPCRVRAACGSFEHTLIRGLLHRKCWAVAARRLAESRGCGCAPAVPGCSRRRAAVRRQ